MFCGGVVYTRSFMDRPPFDIMQNCHSEEISLRPLKAAA